MILLLTAALALTGIGRGLQAQSVRGVLLDSRFSQPIDGGSVFLLSESRERVVATSVDDRGRFSVNVPAPGVYFIGAERYGYEPVLDGPLEFEAEATAEIEIRLARAPIVLDPVTGRAEPRVPHLNSSGFYRRRRSATTGRFLTRQDIESRAPNQVQQILRTIPGVTVEPDIFGRGRVVMTRSRGFSLQGSNCYPAIYIDGIPRYGGDVDGGRIDVHPQDIEAMEVYAGTAGIPAQYGGVGGACGVILIWRRK